MDFIEQCSPLLQAFVHKILFCLVLQGHSAPN